MDKVIEVIGKIFDFLGSQDWKKIFDTIEGALVKVLEWIGNINLG